MLTIYYGEARGKTRLCTGTAVGAAVRDKNVLYVRFAPYAEASEKSPLSLMQSITEIAPQAAVDDDPAQRSRNARAFFDSAVRMALTFQYGMLILDDVFDLIESGLLPAAEVYDFLSNAPDSVDVICTGMDVDEKFLRLADAAVKLEITTTRDKERLI